MLFFEIFSALLFTLSWLHKAHASCEPEISYPAPKYSAHTLADTFEGIETYFKSLLETGTANGSSFSLEISSPNQTIYSHYHFDESLGGSPIDGSSVYRIASNTKLFTALGILKQEAAGKLGLDDEINKYLPALLNKTSKAKWNGITIRSLLAHLSGLPDNYGDEDLLLQLSDPSEIGLPPLSAIQQKSLPQCGAYSEWKVPCTESSISTIHSYYDIQRRLIRCLRYGRIYSTDEFGLCSTEGNFLQ